MHGSRSVRTIIGEYNTKITDHEPTPRNARPGRTPMHDRRTRSGSKYGCEGHSVGSATTGRVFHRGGDFNFAYAGADVFARDRKKTRAQLNRPPNAEDLIRILYHARPLD